MKIFRIETIDGKEYFATKRVRLDDKKFQEFKSTNVQQPETIYVDCKGEVVKDWDTYYALLEKYAVDKRSLQGEIVFDFEEWGWHKISEEKQNEFARKDEQLTELFERDVEVFSKNAARELGHIAAKQTDNPEKWFRDRLDQVGYRYLRRVGLLGRQTAFHSFGLISFSGSASVNNEFVRAHEMAHKLMKASGGVFYFTKEYEKIDEKTGEKKLVNLEMGRAFNEGVTNLLAEKLSGLPVPAPTETSNSYAGATSVARRIIKAVGEDLFFEAVLSNPELLINRIDKLGGKDTYATIATGLDELLLLENTIKRTGHNKDYNNRSIEGVKEFLASGRELIEGQKERQAKELARLEEENVEYSEKTDAMEKQHETLTSKVDKVVTGVEKGAEKAPAR